MCSLASRAHLHMLDHLIPDTAAMRQDFADFIFDEMLWGKGGRIAALKEIPGGETENT